MWSEDRYPLEDVMEEDIRQTNYWAWLRNNVPMSTKAIVVLEDDKGKWVQIKTEADADFEAYHMQHSIGFSWKKYSTLGQVYSCRNNESIPHLTVLVVDGCIVHARGRNNMPINIHQLKFIEIFARALCVNVLNVENL